jgi:hypothetical protein
LARSSLALKMKEWKFDFAIMGKDSKN